jgi:hypothetical protein
MTETGAGAYVALLVTGMAPYWRDYFPGERVNSALGTSFDQPVVFNGKEFGRVKL